jgi:YD repeat-containing protein
MAASVLALIIAFFDYPLDTQEGISNIDWNVYGKIKSITKTNGTIISYSYDASGNRVSKTVNGKEAWYVRDASGNVMALYEKEHRPCF